MISGSPSKQLSETLEQLHLSSPNPIRNQKSYQTNNLFPDSEFASKVGRHSYIRRLSNWSMNYGTVQIQDNRYPNEKENAAQWKHYMESERVKNKLATHSDNLESNLVLTTSLNDLSLIPTNTFKHRRTMMSSHDDEDGQDPADEAKNVFDNVLRKQKSNFSRKDPIYQSNQNLSEFSPAISVSSSSSSSFRSNPVSPISTQAPVKLDHKPSGLQPQHPQKLIQLQKPKLNLITPEDAGMIFNHEQGVWDTINQQTQVKQMDNTISFEDTESLLKPVESNKKIMDINCSKHVGSMQHYNYHTHNNKNDGKMNLSVIDDTPLSTPKFADKFKLYKNVKQEKISIPTHENDNIEAGNITNISKLDTSFRISESEVMSTVLDVIPDKSDWEQVYYLELATKGLSNLIGLNEIVPNCLELNISNNKLNSLNGVPKNCMYLNCHDNKLGSLCSIKDLIHLEQLNLSSNQLQMPNLNILQSNIHLKVVNLSDNKITGLYGIGAQSRIENLNLSNNRIIGIVDFQDLIKDSRSWIYLKELDLCGNKITSLKNLSLLKNLRVLKLDGNPIEVLDGGMNMQLRTISLRNNPALTKVLNLPKPRILRICGDSLIWDSKNFQLSNTIEELEITGGNGSLIKWNLFLPNYLYIRGLKLINMNLQKMPSFISDLSLKSLDLRNNQLTSFTDLIQNLPTTLQNLSIENNPLMLSVLSSQSSDLDYTSKQQLLLKAIHASCPMIQKVNDFDFQSSSRHGPQE